MCGIAGTMNWDATNSLEHMINLQQHRGPDDSGYWKTQLTDEIALQLGSCRLAIQDLSPAGHMPMSTPDGQFTIVYNGEIYNYPALRRQLEAQGYHFRSHSDTKAVLYLYQAYGPACVKLLNGMFALAIWDQERQQLFLACDHFGIKPLYYCQQGARFAFASESKALLQLPGLPKAINYQALNQYLTFLWVPDPLTLFQGIYKLPAGHWAIFKAGHLQIEQYWDLTFPATDHTSFSTDEAALTTELRQRFMATVQSQLLSDVPVGAFLSAGLDSSSIVAAMAHGSSQPVRTYTIAFPSDYRIGEVTMDDTAVARRTAAHFGCQHTEILVAPNVVELLPKLIWHLDEPIADPAVITAYLVNRAARDSVTVLLSGVGGDELFAGYRKYQAHQWASHYRRLPQFLRQWVLEPGIEALPTLRGTRAKGYVRLAKKMARSGSLPSRERFITDSVYLSATQKATLCTAQLQCELANTNAWQRHLADFDQVAQADFLNQMLYVDLKTFMVSLNLTYNDKMSMASSVEVRVPFLDWELAEWVAWNIPPHLKLKGNTTKYILREAMRPLLPPEVLTQKKAGFGAPSDYWLANEVKPMVDALLSESLIKQRGLFNASTVRRMIDEQRRGKQDWSLQIWQLLTLELWMQTFID